MGQPWVNVGSTFGQRSVFSLAISGRFSLILQVSSIKTEDKTTCICKMVDFPIRKWDFRVCGWSGAFWEPLERKKRENQMYLQDIHAFAPLRTQDFSKIATCFSWIYRNFSRFCRISIKFYKILTKFRQNFTRISPKFQRRNTRPTCAERCRQRGGFPKLSRDFARAQYVPI